MSGEVDGDDGALVADVAIVNEKGLHARASARFAATAERYDAEVMVSRDDLTVSAESIMGLLMLAAASGSTLRLQATGRQAEDALAALQALVADRFGEPR